MASPPPDLQSADRQTSQPSLLQLQVGLSPYSPGQLLNLFVHPHTFSQAEWRWAFLRYQGGKLLGS